MMQRIFVPLLCLVAGLALGFWSGRRQNVTPAGPSREASLSAVAPAAPKPLATPPATATRAAALSELAEDYSPKRAQKLADSMNVEELLAGLSQLARRSGETGARSMRLELVRSWARRDPSGAWKAALALPESRERASFLGTIAGVMAGSNPEAALKLAMALEKPGERREVLRTLFDEWGRSNPTAALGYWRDHPEIPVDGYIASTILGGASSRDPALAARLAISMPAGSDFDSGMSLAMSKWVEMDPTGARQWIETLTDPAQKDRARKAFCSARTLGDPKLALEVASQITDSDLKQTSQKSVLSNWLRSDPEAASSYLGSAAGQAISAGTEYYISSAIADLTPQEQNSALAKLPEGEWKERIVAGLVKAATSKGNYSLAVGILNAMADSQDRDRSLHDLAIRWTRSNPKAVSGWIDKQADSSDRDLIMAGYSATLAATDPQAAIKFAQSIPDKDVQKAALRNILAKWVSADEQAADAWIAASGSYSEQEKKLIQIMSKVSSFSSSTPRIKNRR